jgi:hypothetical protein
MLSKHLKELKGKAFLNNFIYIVHGKSGRLGHLAKYCSVTCIEVCFDQQVYNYTVVGRLDLPVYTEGRAARCRRSACAYAVPRGIPCWSYLGKLTPLPGRQGISELRGLPGKGNERLWVPQRPSRLLAGPLLHRPRPSPFPPHSTPLVRPAPVPVIDTGVTYIIFISNTVIHM